MLLRRMQRRDPAILNFSWPRHTQLSWPRRIQLFASRATFVVLVRTQRRGPVQHMCYVWCVLVCEIQHYMCAMYVKSFVQRRFEMEEGAVRRAGDSRPPLSTRFEMGREGRGAPLHAI